jgi:hypothetical protein
MRGTGGTSTRPAPNRTRDDLVADIRVEPRRDPLPLMPLATAADPDTSVRPDERGAGQVAATVLGVAGAACPHSLQ